jgi:superfamily II DNA/RNA helicase
MAEIVDALENLHKKILTSATNEPDIPAFIEVRHPVVIDFLAMGVKDLSIKIVASPSKDKLETLRQLICHLGRQPGIVFCNYRESIDRVSSYLNECEIDHECFYGGMEQRDRERALIKFRNGSCQLLLATDLAARGIDIQEIRFIIHYHLPLRSQEFTHRNGRTARMHNEGAAYVIKWAEDILPDFIEETAPIELRSASVPAQSAWTTLFISGGRKDKISKGDIAGLLLKQGGIKSDQLGIIELKQDCAFVAIHRKMAAKVIEKTNNSKLKKKKVRVFEV